MPRRPVAAALALTVVGSLLGGNPASACTGGALTARDGSVAVGRTLEFGQPLDSQIAVWPAGSSIQGLSTRGAGLRFKTRYGFVGATAGNNSDMLAEGLNEKGLNVGLFYFPGYAHPRGQGSLGAHPGAGLRSGRVA